MRGQWLLLATGLLLVSAGCQSLSSGTGLPGTSSESMSSDPWIHEAGTIARAEHPPEPVNEASWFRNLWASEKAREIERNLGVGD